MIERGVELHLWLTRRRRWVLVGLGLFGVACLVGGLRLKLSEDFTDMLPLSDPAIARQFEALRQMRQADRLFVDVSVGTDSPEVLAAAADQMHAALLRTPGMGDLRYRVEDAAFQETYESLQAQIPGLLTAGDLEALEARLSPEAIERRLTWLTRTLSQPQGLALKEVIQRDPIGLGDALASRLRNLQAGMGEARLVEGRITSGDGRHVLISAAPEFPSSDRRRSAPLIAAVLEAAGSVERQFAADSARVAVTGAHRVSLDNASLIVRDAAITAAVATVAVLALMLWVYRELRFALLTLTPPLFGGLTATLALALTGEPVSAIALGCGSILIGITDDYGNHILYHTDDTPLKDHRSLGELVARLALPLTFGALATLAAFLLMLLSPVPGHRQVGLFAAVGVAAAAAYALTLLPLFVPVRADRPVRPRPLTPLIARVFAWRDRRARWVIPLLLLGSVLCAVGFARLEFEGDLTRLNGVTPETRRDDEAIRGLWGKALSLTTVVVRAPSREEALRKNERLYAALAPLQERGLIESLSSVAPLLPSEETRRANRQRWREFWSDDRQTRIRRTLRQVAAPLGFREDAFDGFLRQLAAPPEAPVPSAPGPDPLARWTGEFLGRTDQGIAFYTWLKGGGPGSLDAVQAAALRAVPDGLVLNKTALAAEIAQVARGGLLTFAFLILALNALLLLSLLGCWDLVGVTLLPVVAGLFWTLGTLGLLGVPISVANFIFVIFVVGVSIDYSLFLVTAKLDPVRGHAERTVSTGGSITACALTTLLGFGALVLARHPALFSVGLTALLGISFCLVATLFLVPIGMDWLLRRHATRVSAPVTSLPDRHRAVSRLYRYQGPYARQFAYWKMRTDPLFRVLEEVVPPRGCILDLGCGFGMASHWLALGSAERRILGVDNDETKIRVAQATARGRSRVGFERRNLLDWEFPACDVLLLLDVLHYLPRELKAAVLAKGVRALRPGGCLILRDACADEARHRGVSWAERWAVRLGQNKTVHGLHFETREGHQTLLRESGFVEVRVREDAGHGSNRLWTARSPGGSEPVPDAIRG